MHAGKLVFAQLMNHLPLHIFGRCVAKYPGRYPALTFSHLDQFLCMAFAHLTYRESLRDIVGVVKLMGSQAPKATTHQRGYTHQRGQIPS